MASTNAMRVPKELLVTSVGESYYGFDSTVVHEIMPGDAVTPAAHAPPEIAGLVLVGEQTAPVFDLFWKFGVDAPSTGDEVNLVVVDWHERLVAMRVGEIHEPVALPGSAYQPLQLPSAHGFAFHFEAVADWHGELVFWLNPLRLIPPALVRAAA